MAVTLEVIMKYSVISHYLRNAAWYHSTLIRQHDIVVASKYSMISYEPKKQYRCCGGIEKRYCSSGDLEKKIAIASELALKNILQ